MKNNCEKCQGRLGKEDEAFSCDYGCTFCFGCASGMDWNCPNCQGKLVQRLAEPALEVVGDLAEDTDADNPL